MRGAGRSSSAGLAEEPFQHVDESSDCTQVGDEPEESDAMDWLMDDEMMRPWREVGKDEEDMSVKSCELVVAQTQVRRR